MNYSGCVCVWVCAPKNTCPGFTQLYSYLTCSLTVFSETTSVHFDASKTWPYKTKPAFLLRLQLLCFVIDLVR